jgi:hypothetical protein
VLSGRLALTFDECMMALVPRISAATVVAETSFMIHLSIGGSPRQVFRAAMRAVLLIPSRIKTM